LSQADFLAAQKTITAAQKIDNEMIVSSAYPVEFLLNTVSKSN